MNIDKMFFHPVEPKTVKIKELEPGQKATLQNGKEFLAMSNDGEEVRGVMLNSPMSFMTSSLNDECEVGAKLNICI